jgi:hypothetical protein
MLDTPPGVLRALLIGEAFLLAISGGRLFHDSVDNGPRGAMPKIPHLPVVRNAAKAANSSVSIAPAQ